MPKSECRNKCSLGFHQPEEVVLSRRRRDGYGTDVASGDIRPPRWVAQDRGLLQHVTSGSPLQTQCRGLTQIREHRAGNLGDRRLIVGCDPVRSQCRRVNRNFINLPVHKTVEVLVKAQPGANMGWRRKYVYGIEQVHLTHQLSVEIKAERRVQTVVDRGKMEP